MKKEKEKPVTTLQKLERIHPHFIMMALAILGISIVFAMLLAGFAFSLKGLSLYEGLALPAAFTWSTLALLLSSLALARAFPAFRNDKTALLSRSLSLTLALGTAFAVLQVAGWVSLQQEGVAFKGVAAGTYLYLLSGLHLTHLLGGLVCLALLARQVLKVTADPVASLLYVANPISLIRLKLMAVYWHFMDILWLVLYGCMLAAL